MSTLYKLTTKVITEHLTLFVEMRNVLSDNQMGTRRGCQGANETALVNKNINKKYGHNLSTTRFDIKKAFDFVSHEYLCYCLEKLQVPDWCRNFVQSVIKNGKYN